MPNIHPSSIVDKNAKIADSVTIGPFCSIGPNVEIGDNCVFVSHCSITGYTKIGNNNRFFPFVSIGLEPQDYAFKGTKSSLKIGDGNVFREGFTANPGTKEDTETIIGNNCYFMMNSHVAHNCKVGNKVILVNCAQISGYVEVGDNAILSGLTGVHQFCRIGRLAMISGGSTISMDLPPFMIASGRNAIVAGVNLVGLKRNSFPKESIDAIVELFKIFFRERLNTSNAIIKAEQNVPQLPEVKEFIDFVKNSKRGILNRQKEGR